MTVTGFIKNLPLYNDGCKAFHQAWKETDVELGEVRDLAEKFKKPDEDLAALDLYRTTARTSVAGVKKADVLQTIVEPIFLLGGLCGFVGTGILAINGVFPTFASGAITAAATMACAYVGGALYFKAQAMRRQNDPNRALMNLPFDVRNRVGNLLSQKDGMKEVSTLATSLKPAATTTIAQTESTVVLGGVIVRKRRDGTAVAEGSNNPTHPNPRMF